MDTLKNIIFKFCGSEMIVECKMNQDVYCPNCGVKGMWDSDWDNDDRWEYSKAFFCTGCRSRIIVQDILPPTEDSDVRLQ